MARLIVKTAHAPFILEPQQNPVKICMCGLSKKQPFCDGSHLKTTDEKENALYEYTDTLDKEELGGCGGGDTCCGHCEK